MEAIDEEILPWEESTSALLQTWTAAESPESHYTIGSWVPFFEVAGFTRDGEVAEKPSLPITLYRGTTVERRRSMSWTEDLDVARWFAARIESAGSVGVVFQARVQPWRLLAYIHETGRFEAEWVIDPRRIRVEVIESRYSTPPVPSFEEMRSRIAAQGSSLTLSP